MALASFLTDLLDCSSDFSGSRGYDAPSCIKLQSLLHASARRIIELGAGTGLVSLALAAALYNCRCRLRASRSELSQGGSAPTLLVTDLREPFAAREYRSSETTMLICESTASALPLLDRNISLNCALWNTPESKGATGPCSDNIDVKGAILDWEQDIPTRVWSDTSDSAGEIAGPVQASPFDLIMWVERGNGFACALLIIQPTLCRAADITYNTASFPHLIRVIKGLITGPPNTASSTAQLKPPILLAYKQRHQDERELWDMARNELGISWHKIAQLDGHEVSLDVDVTCPHSEHDGQTGSIRSGMGPVEIWLGYS